MAVLDVSRIAARRRAVWWGGIALTASPFILAWGPGLAAPDPVSTVLGAAAWPLLVVVVLKVARPLRAGRHSAARVAAGLAAALGVLQLGLAVGFLASGAPRTAFPAMLAVLAAWGARVLAGAARAVLGPRPSRLDAALLRVAVPVLAAAVVVAVAAAAVVHADLLGRLGSEPVGVQWAVVLLAVAAYLDVRAVVEAWSPAPALGGPEPPERLIPTWEPPSRRTRLMYGTVLGTVVGCVIGAMSAAWLLILAMGGPLTLPLLVIVGRLGWRLSSMTIRLLGQAQLTHRQQGSFLGSDYRPPPDVLYLRSFPVDRWRVRSEAIRYPSGRYGRPPFEEVVARRLWHYGTVVAAERPGFAAGGVGAAKSRLAAEGWHISVVQWMRDASLVVVAAGVTGGLLWELQQLGRLGLQDKLFLVVPPVQHRWSWWLRRRGRAEDITADWEVLCRLVAQVGGLTVPDRIDVRRTRAVIPGLGGGDAELIVSGGDRDFDYEAAVELAATITLARQRPRAEVGPAPALAAPRPPPPPPPAANPPPTLAAGAAGQPLHHSRGWYGVAAAAVVGSVAWLLLAALDDRADVAAGRTDAGPLLLALFGSIVLFLAGTTLAFVVLILRSQARRTRPSPASVPAWAAGAVPGWYPDPDGRLELRYWDGLRWTEHVFHGGVQAVDYGPPQPVN